MNTRVLITEPLRTRSYEARRMSFTRLFAVVVIPVFAAAAVLHAAWSPRTGSAAVRTQAQVEGTWSGVTVRTPDAGPPVSLRLRVYGVSGDSVRLDLTIAESRQIALAIPSPYSDSSHATLRGDSLHVEFTPDIGLAFISRLVPSASERIVFAGRVRGDSITGRFRITAYESPITLRRLVPDTTNAAPIFFHSTQDSLRLGGTLILPRGRGPFPAVVFVTGSDPDTREAWQIEARALAARGVAALLYDKRGVAESRGASHDLASWDDLAGDVEGAVAYLRSRTDVIDPRRIGLIGQSQGTWMNTKVAARDPRIAFLVNISGGAMSGAEQETYRTGALMRRDGFSTVEIARAQAFQRQKFAVARTGLGWAQLEAEMQRLRADSVRWFPGYGTGAATRTLAALRLYGVLQFNYDPRRDLMRIQVPTLVIMGENDVVFPPDTVVARMRDALARGGNHQVTTRILPGTGHGMGVRQSVDGRPFRYVISEQFIEVLADWVARQAGQPP